MTEQEIKDRIENKICLECGNHILDNSVLFCRDCYEKAKVNIDKIPNDWGSNICLMVFVQILNGGNSDTN